MKVYASIRSANRVPPAAATFDVEYTLLEGDKRSDCVALTPAPYTNEASLVFALKQALRAHLVAKYAPEPFSTNDVVLFGG